MRFSTVAIFSLITATLAAPIQLEARDNTAIYAGAGAGVGLLALGGSAAAYRKYKSNKAAEEVVDEAREPLLNTKNVVNKALDPKYNWMNTAQNDMKEAAKEATGTVKIMEEAVDTYVEDTAAVFKEALSAPEKLIGKTMDEAGIKFGQVLGHY